jgi:hypothetical protein
MPNATVRANARSMPNRARKPTKADFDRAMSDPAYALAVKLVDAMTAAEAADGPEGDAHQARAYCLRAALALTPAKNRSGTLAHIVELRHTAREIAAMVPLVVAEPAPELIERLTVLEQLAERLVEALDAGII